MKPHKWAKEIKAWADGAEIEMRYWDRETYGDVWEIEEYPNWNDSLMEFRIKQRHKEPQYLYAYKVNAKIVELYDELQMAWDGKMLLGKIKLEQDDE